MNIRHLRIFIAIVDHQTMNAASKVLHIAQPSISQAISEMENYYGIRLFDRLSKRLYLTESGKKLLPYARYLVSSFDNFELEMKNAAAKPTVRLGSTIVFSSCILPELASKIQAADPSIHLNITVTNTKAVERMILDSELDVGFVEGVPTSPDITRTHLATDQLCIICGRTHKFYGKTISIQDLDGESVISREEFSFLRNYFDQLAKEHNITYRETWRCSGNEAILSAVNSGHGITIISSILIADELRSGKYYAIPIKDVNLTREFYLIHHKDKFMYPALKKTIQTSYSHIAELIREEEKGSRFLLP